jgi:hypothetical protein
MEQDVSDDAAEEPTVQSVEAARSGDDEVGLPRRSGRDDLVRSVAQPDLRLCGDAVLRQPSGHLGRISVMECLESIELEFRWLIS